MNRLCGCCEVVVAPPVENRPGLSAIAYRIGTFSSFLEAMQEAISRRPELALQTRESDDYAITFLQLWAAVGDVLTFYQERYANEAFLRTATFRESIARLTRMISYRLRPGVAAETPLAFTLDAGRAFTIPAGLKVQSVPGPGQQPQTFETLAPVSADYRLDELSVHAAPEKLASPLPASSTSAVLDRLQGPAMAAGLAAGDHVILFRDGTSTATEEKQLAAVVVEGDLVRLDWTSPITGGGWTAATAGSKLGRRFRLFGYDAPATYLVPVSSGGLITWQQRRVPGWRYPARGSRAERKDILCLDASYTGIAAGQRLLVDDAVGTRVVVEVTAVAQTVEQFGSVAGTVTALTVVPDLAPIVDRRRVVVHELLGPLLGFWGGRYPSPITSADLYLPGLRRRAQRGDGVVIGRQVAGGGFTAGSVLWLDEIETGRAVLLTDARGEVLAATILGAAIDPPAGDPDSFCHLVLTVSPASSSPMMLTAPVTLAGNVAPASHGKTVAGEVVGSGDASTSFQTMALMKSPLTFLPGPGPDGLASTLRLSVDGVRWTEVDSLYEQVATARVFTERLADDGLTTLLRFGDGKTGGATVPTGRGNVTATYRVGGGRDGNLPADSLTTVLDRLPGLVFATNPLPAHGGAEAEPLDQVRRNAPRTVLTFGRAVSLRDFEDLVSASGSVAKAQATWLWDGYTQAIYLTVAGDGGDVMDDAALDRLAAVLATERDPNHRLRLASYRRVPIVVAAAVATDLARDPDRVLGAARQVLQDALSFQRQALGGVVHLSAVYQVLQAVEGVVAVDVTGLAFKDPADAASHGAAAQGGVPVPVQPHLGMLPGRADPLRPGQALPAELAWVQSPSQDLTISHAGGLS